MSRDKEKAATTDLRALDIRALSRAGVLTNGWSGSWSWRRRNEAPDSIGVEVISLYCLRLRYQRTSNDKTELKDYLIQITHTPCHLGGNRPWFLCPCCGRRVAKLYQRSVFACRDCQRLNYESQQASKRDRAADHSWKLRVALGCEENFFCAPADSITKPKGMQWRTFKRKVDQLKQYDARALADAGAMLATIERKLIALE
jgi:hypothetical protein